METKKLPKFCEKECRTHGKTDFVLEGRGYYRCKKCRSGGVAKRRRKIKLMAVDYKGGSCEACGYNKCVAALEFHHEDPSQKDFGISNKGYARSWEKVKLELDKCIMLCSNCHHEEHSKQEHKQF